MDNAALAVAIGQNLRDRGYLLTVAESCTGGGIASVLTDVVGCSAWFERGFIAYSNEAKQELLGLRTATLEAHGSVSEAAVREMASGAFKNSHAQVAIAVSGIAGPGGGSPEKPVGTVWFAWAIPNADIRTSQQLFQGDRITIRTQTINAALIGLLNTLSPNS